MGLLVSLFSMRYGRIAMLARFACVLLGFVMIAGFVVGGGSPVKVLLRGVGPTLTGFNVAGAISQPEIDLYNSAGVVIQTNKVSG